MYPGCYASATTSGDCRQEPGTPMAFGGLGMMSLAFIASLSRSPDSRSSKRRAHGKSTPQVKADIAAIASLVFLQPAAVSSRNTVKAVRVKVNLFTPYFHNLCFA